MLKFNRAYLSPLIGLFLIGLMSFPYSAESQITDIDTFLENLEDKAVDTVCGAAGFKFVQPALLETPFEPGATAENVSKYFSEQNFERKLTGLYGAPTVVTSSMSCEQRSSVTFLNFCRVDKVDNKDVIVLARASFGLKERDNRCQHGLRSPIEFSYHEHRTVSLARPLAADPYAHFDIAPDQEWEAALETFQGLDWALEDGLLKRSYYCENGSNNRVEFLSKEDDGMLLKIRVHLKIECENSLETQAKIAEIEALF